MDATMKLASLHRYPVKSMAGEELDTAFVGFSGLYGDRLYAIRSTGCDVDFPYLTGREKSTLLLYRPQFRDAARAAHPEQLDAADSIEPTLNVRFDPPDALDLAVETPDGNTLAIDDPALLTHIATGLKDRHRLSLMRSDSGYTDCRPISLISRQTVDRIAMEIGVCVDARRFRANLILDHPDSGGFSENRLLGKTIRIGERVEILVVAKDPRCKMIALDPDSGKLTMKVLRHVASAHDGFAGVYGVVVQDGLIRNGDRIMVRDD